MHQNAPPSTSTIEASPGGAAAQRESRLQRLPQTALRQEPLLLKTDRPPADRRAPVDPLGVGRLLAEFAMQSRVPLGIVPVESAEVPTAFTVRGRKAPRPAELVNQFRVGNGQELRIGHSVMLAEILAQNEAEIGSHIPRSCTSS